MPSQNSITAKRASSSSGGLPLSARAIRPSRLPTSMSSTWEFPSGLLDGLAVHAGGFHPAASAVGTGCRRGAVGVPLALVLGFHAQPDVLLAQFRHRPDVLTPEL